jgi:hypothetical protein
LEAEPETPPADYRNHRRSKHRSDSPEDSQEYIQSLHHHHQLTITNSIFKFKRSRGDDCKDKYQGYKENDYFVPTFPKKDQLEAFARMTAAFNQVDPAVYLN